MAEQKLLPIILAGGSGTRLWPLSRQLRPKQFLPLPGPQTLLQQTLQRLDKLSCLPPWLVCHEDHRFLAAEQVRESQYSIGKLLLEPCGKNTAPAIALAAFMARQNHDSPLLLVLPADHAMEETQAFADAVNHAISLAKTGRLVTFGIKPTYPETGYGYLKQGEPLDAGWQVDTFVEKPDTKRAKEYLNDSSYYWNSGMFLFQADAILAELKATCPDIYQACQLATANPRFDHDFTRIDAAAYQVCPAQSIDYAVMENTQQAAMVPLDAGWSDLGTWSSLKDTLPTDENGNAQQGDVITQDTHRCLIQAESRLVAALGVKDLTIAETADAVLVAAHDAEDNLKTLVARLQEAQRQEVTHHREVYRPWGSYDSLSRGARYQVKKMVVQPGASLSLQKHYHRAEHWVIVRGTAEVTNGDKVYLLDENQSTYIPIGQIHSLKNPGKIPLELIEIQSGGYLGEDDIERIEDHYGRS